MRSLVNGERQEDAAVFRLWNSVVSCECRGQRSKDSTPPWRRRSGTTSRADTSSPNHRIGSHDVGAGAGDPEVPLTRSRRDELERRTTSTPLAEGRDAAQFRLPSALETMVRPERSAAQQGDKAWMPAIIDDTEGDGCGLDS